MIFYRSIILSAVLLICSFYCGAQDSNYVYQDSTLLYEDSAAPGTKIKEELPGSQNDEHQNDDGYIADTLLRYNELFVESDSIKELKKSKPFAYAKNLDSLLSRYQQSLVKEETSAKNDISWLGRILFSRVTKYFFWMVALVFVSFILYKLFFTEGFFQKAPATINVTGLPGEDEGLSKNTDYGKLIAHAISTRNFRAAVRYHYLQSLQKLSSKAAIQFAADKTNYQYVRELSGKTYKNAFASLTLDYEYVWYGEFEIDEKIFNSIQNKFKQFNNEV